MWQMTNVKHSQSVAGLSSRCVYTAMPSPRYPMDDQPRGDTVHDHSGNGFHGTASGNYSRSCSHFTMTGAAAPATPQQIYVPPTFAAALVTSLDFTFAAWVRLKSVGSMRVLRIVSVQLLKTRS